jgi:hypothetical protein
MSGPEKVAYVCQHVFERSRPILLVSREGGDWQFLCGGSHGTKAVPRVVGINHVISEDPTLQEVLDLPVDWEAERQSRGSPWNRMKVRGVH